MQMSVDANLKNIEFGWVLLDIGGNVFTQYLIFNVEFQNFK